MYVLSVNEREFCLGGEEHPPHRGRAVLLQEPLRHLMHGLQSLQPYEGRCGRRRPQCWISYD